MKKKIYWALSASLILASCGSKTATEAPQEKTQTSKIWQPKFFINRYYMMQEKNATNPRLGGPPQIRFEAEPGQLSYNTGDIMNAATYTITGNMITVKDRQSNHNIRLKIQDANTLVAENGSIYQYDKTITD